MSLRSGKLIELPVDGRQSQTALKVARGTARLLHAHGFCVVSDGRANALSSPRVSIV